MEVVLPASIAYLFLGKLVQCVPRQYLLELGTKTKTRMRRKVGVLDGKVQPEEDNQTPSNETNK